LDFLRRAWDSIKTVEGWFRKASVKEPVDILSKTENEGQNEGKLNNLCEEELMENGEEVEGELADYVVVDQELLFTSGGGAQAIDDIVEHCSRTKETEEASDNSDTDVVGEVLPTISSLSAAQDDANEELQILQTGNPEMQKLCDGIGDILSFSKI
jgi:hypothetical protein